MATQPNTEFDPVSYTMALYNGIIVSMMLCIRILAMIKKEHENDSSRLRYITCSTWSGYFWAQLICWISLTSISTLDNIVAKDWYRLRRLRILNKKQCVCTSVWHIIMTQNRWSRRRKGKLKLNKSASNFRNDLHFSVLFAPLSIYLFHITKNI